MSHTSKYRYLKNLFKNAYIWVKERGREVECTESLLCIRICATLCICYIFATDLLTIFKYM